MKVMAVKTGEGVTKATAVKGAIPMLRPRKTVRGDCAEDFQPCALNPLMAAA